MEQLRVKDDAMKDQREGPVHSSPHASPGRATSVVRSFRFAFDGLSYLLRTQGRLAWRRFNEALTSGRLPHREVVDGVLVIFGGVLLLTPGFITDIFGLLFLFPPTRVVLRRLLVRKGALRLVGAMPGTGTPPRAQYTGNGRPHDIEGSAVDIDPPPPPR